MSVYEDYGIDQIQALEIAKYVCKDLYECDSHELGITFTGEGRSQLERNMSSLASVYNLFNAKLLQCQLVEEDIKAEKDGITRVGSE